MRAVSERRWVPFLILFGVVAGSLTWAARTPGASPTGPAVRTPGQPGSAVEDAGYSLAVVAVEHPARPECDPWYYPAPGTKLVAVEIVVGCLSCEQVDVHPILAVLVDQDGVAHMAELGALARHNQLTPRAIGPGEWARGRVGFELPEATAPSRLKYVFFDATLEVALAEAP
jgi:hypothetical protein